ncbi:lipocalin family protein [Spirosoma soli]|uniref:Lipocalin family protein n=2 Tax=Spirosoma soli TaxID=1770529 RepID=A0ABW5MBX8_9BACT
MMNLSRLMVWAFVLVMPLMFASCKKDGNEVVNPSGNAVEGSWKISDIKISDGKDSQSFLDYIVDLYAQQGAEEEGAKLIACLKDSRITLNGDGKVTGAASPKCESEDSDDLNPAKSGSTWKVNGNKLTITDSDGSETFDLTVSGNTMTWSNQEEDDLDGDGINEKYTFSIEFRKA